MKKITTIIILFAVFICSLFAEPKVPVYSYEKDSNLKENPYFYLSNDCQNIYEVQAFYDVSSKYVFRITNKSLITKTYIRLEILFPTKKLLDNFNKTIHLSDLENEFLRLRELLILNDALQIIKPDDKDFDFSNPPKSFYYGIDGTKIKL